MRQLLTNLGFKFHLDKEKLEAMFLRVDDIVEEKWDLPKFASWFKAEVPEAAALLTSGNEPS